MSLMRDATEGSLYRFVTSVQWDRVIDQLVIKMSITFD